MSFTLFSPSFSIWLVIWTLFQRHLQLKSTLGNVAPRAPEVLLSGTERTVFVRIQLEAWTLLKQASSTREKEKRKAKRDWRQDLSFSWCATAARTRHERRELSTHVAGGLARGDFDHVKSALAFLNHSNIGKLNCWFWHINYLIRVMCMSPSQQFTKG